MVKGSTTRNTKGKKQKEKSSGERLSHYIFSVFMNGSIPFELLVNFFMVFC